ncbi:methylated-DNA-[protein]-cysteine S-methyltransferase, active site protein [Purpureocillium lilacinum]|uniref:Methylated-DNA--protein-cysteine methyltransferase n=1 Tax=Purpureocillium lilacinum TaxID=33203 RepID=A0A179HDY0_PURLI|nr:methylated-DNA-[protein]-cysteine S-methyltransferase, active site protein [Purpureocillium lilacinum]OAQ88224.1 methylated-DNA-[protein]-cysteine S-methyltransferase, active site protein [Purpureocillium lilacinum]GJN75143.1 hypothetical protein PLICBS_009239 [Purpureocillium lilacinum]GJN85121.1 hypothetical protein PLIIFM63780_008685 [Purpureocillium lilacinum]
MAAGTKRKHQDAAVAAPSGPSPSKALKTSPTQRPSTSTSPSAPRLSKRKAAPPPIPPSPPSTAATPEPVQPSSAAAGTGTGAGTTLEQQQQQMQPQLALIAASSRTPFEKRVWAALCGIPRGRVTTYGHLSAHLGSSPRAVGNALRRNPFAPAVPCHRVVATGMSLGGFKGKWPRDGEGITLDEKRRLLRAEGIRFDDKGRVLGTPWVGWD